MFNKILKLGADYADVRISNSIIENISIENSKPSVAMKNYFKFGVRVFYKGAFGFCAGDEFEKIPEALSLAFKSAKLASKKVKEKFKIKKQSNFTDEVKAPCKLKNSDVDIEEKLALAFDVDKYFKSKKGIKSRTINFVFNTLTHEFFNSAGAHIIEEKSISDLRLQISSIYKGKLISGYGRLGRSDGFDYFKKKNLLSIAKETYEDLKRQKKAIYAPAGKMPVIMDNDLTGVFFHEAVGHACEADSILNDTSVLKGKIGKQIAPEFLTLRDSPNIKFEHGYFKYDDEGFPAGNTILIKNGVLNSFMHSLETASKMNANPTGNGRAQSPFHIPIPRMTNTIIEPGDYSFEELFNEIRFGIYAKGSFGGVVDPTNGNFLFNAQEAFLIENGVITKPLKGVSFGGNILETLMKVEKIANDDKSTFVGGFCGKEGQLVPVGAVAPHILISEAMIGGSR